MLLISDPFDLSCTAGPEARYILCRGRQAPVCMPKKSDSPEGATQEAKELGDWRDSITRQRFERARMCRPDGPEALRAVAAPGASQP